MVEQDSRSSLRHILADEPVEQSPRPAPPATPASAPAVRAVSTAANGEHEQSPAPKGDKDEEHEAETPLYTSTTQTTRRNANGSVSSVYSGNKIRHLKKEDGVPLWRKDIQYDFLDIVFKDEQRVFTRYSDNEKGHTFAEIYVDAMAKSSKCSKILKEKLKEDLDSAITMAMVCLLVNVGRMNTTLNFFPEMRAQLRTYHSIPALQAHQDPNAYKQLQDAPRLKSILKGATEDTPQPGTIEDIRQASIPRTNPVNLIFVLSQYAPKISELHFNHPRDFFDLVMRSSLSSKSRATAFLWLMWWYLESDFSNESALSNPFGAGCEPEGGGPPIKVPALESLTEEQAALENVDSVEEKEYGEQKRKERIAIVASEPSPAMTALKRARKERSLFAAGLGDANSDAGTKTPSRDFDSPAPYGMLTLNYRAKWWLTSIVDSLRRNYAGSDYTRSPTPPTSSFQAVNIISKPLASKSVLAEVDEKEPEMLQFASPSVGTPQAAALPKKGSGRGNWNTNIHHPFLLPNPVPMSPPALDTLPDSVYLQSRRDHLPTSSYQLQTRNRPLTSHQKAVSDYRRVRINQIIDTGIRRRHIAAKRQRQEEGILLRAWKRIRMLPAGWDSEDEGPIEKAKDDAKDKDDGVGRRSKEEEKAAAALRRAAGGVRILGGFALPLTDKELEQEKQRPLNSIANVARDDVGEEALYFSRAFSLGMVQLDREENADLEGSLLRPSPQLKLVDDTEDERELQAMDEVAATIVKPRQGRKSRGGGGGASRKSKGGASKLAGEAKDGTPADSRLSTARPDNDAEDEEMHDEGNTTIGPSAELDDDERELLGEADTEDEEEDEDNMDED
ncbi:hypothetical protein E4T38_05564 [Aureobasidium subglaciale]|nr:hypothetical protein E4T38_05564 [Aureobasidium subglaciale]KAI5221269.1 hypothetical protein E4T40_05497 [Aureobasidium subglaciale]KAI5225300.1 hypothetical protein E4T41_05316 [Aureobasidium subglaciale]KAI5261333.1 hypothetical protein E4T46_05260 [Aureobasidium subglaciale]